MVLLLGLAGVGLGRAVAAVTLSWFKATPQPDYILVEWETATEINTLGFYILRSTNVNGPFNAASRINPILIPARSLEDGGFLLPHQYPYPDLTAMPGVAYFYVLEEIDTSGTSHRYFDFKASAMFGTPFPTVTATPTVTHTPLASATPTRTPVRTATPTKSPTSTTTPAPATHTPLTLGGATVTSPPPRPTDTRPAPTSAPAIAQPTAMSQPAAPSPTPVKPAQPPPGSLVLTAARSATAGPMETAALPTPGPDQSLVTPMGTRPAAVAPVPVTPVVSPLPGATASVAAAPQEQPSVEPGERLTAEPTPAGESSRDLSLILRMGGALGVGVLALVLARFLRPAG